MNGLKISLDKKDLFEVLFGDKKQLLKDWLVVIFVVMVVGWLIGLSLVTHENNIRLNNIPIRQEGE